MMLTIKTTTTGTTENVTTTTTTINDDDVSKYYYHYCFLVAGCRNVSCRKNRTCVLDKYERALCIKCNYPCGSYHGGEVCGADNITYQSNCHLKQKTCEKGTTIGVAYKGRCHGKEQPSICSLFSFNVNFSFECQILPCDCIGYWRSLVARLRILPSFLFLRNSRGWPSVLTCNQRNLTLCLFSYAFGLFLVLRLTLFNLIINCSF